MFKRIALVTSALMLAAGMASAASAATASKPAPVAHPRSQASLQCSAQADAKGLHGKARVAFRHDCLRKAKYHKASNSKAPARPAANDRKPDNKT